MKNFLIILLTGASFLANAQTEKGIFFDANLGTRIGGQTSEFATLKPGFHAEGGMGYMFSNIIGIKGHIGYSTFNAVSVANTGFNDKSSIFNATLEGVLGLSQLAGFGTEKFDLYVHAGFGFNTFSNPDYKEGYTTTSEFKDRFFKGNDDAMNVTFGLTPRFHINEKFSLNVDAAYSVIFNQSNSLDRQIGNTSLEGASGMTFVTLGMTYRL
ncbi:porin family protein [Crocinitomix sp.]|nr:porin family protein [Crocinitomix sp.]